MTDCCSTTDEFSKNKRHYCPKDGKECLAVPYTTVIQHLKKPWSKRLKQQAYYFCSDSECDVVYFSKDNSVIVESEVRTLVGLKNQKGTNFHNAALICYCFDISYGEAQENKLLMQYVIDKTKTKQCACDSQNPSGNCCLKDFKLLLNK